MAQYDAVQPDALPIYAVPPTERGHRSGVPGPVREQPGTTPTPPPDPAAQSGRTVRPHSPPAQPGTTDAVKAMATAKTAATATSTVRLRTSRPRQYFSGSVARRAAASAIAPASR